MAFPILAVPRFPNVPNVPGVPLVLRDPANFAANQLTGAVQARVNFAAGTVTGSVSGVINQVNGLVSQVSGSFTGALDVATGNVGGQLRANILGGGSITAGITGLIAGTPNQTTGALIGTLRSSLSNVAGSLFGSAGDSLALTGQPVIPAWGLYDADGNLALTADSVLAFDYRGERRLSDFPVEEGGFETYNKVAVPQECQLVLTKGGSESDRADFLSQVASVLDSLDLYDAVTPEVTYTGMNAQHVDYGRTRENGANLLKVSIWLQEIRVTATATYVNTKTPAGAGTRNDGPVLPRTPTPFVSAAVGDFL